MITIRNYERKDAHVTWELKFQTIRNINIRDYSSEQVTAWAPANFDMDVWLKRVDNMKPFIAELNGQVVGFADLQQDGYIDHFFCHADYQGIGVGRALMEHIFSIGRLNGVSRYYSAVSLTARPFYERYGFRVVKEQQMEVNGLLLTNFVMEKIS
ncbi:GNAT family N-acetyltransferase [Vibrio hangzhouensis]|uniref:Acetyltransferase, GNAT family n=1 Tax=Vibrio hangzhouensis TaxID=462991 RepID=A0A1H5SGL9_9VIBR|nr:GNAT family N-acetyltransferase [Vibrio hangzhouensis]SEF48941.1 Acetyltransferase, GNAT family [Vibrio hangzhouensis]